MPRGSAATRRYDATGKYFMPGIVNTHMHWHDEREPGTPQPISTSAFVSGRGGDPRRAMSAETSNKSKQWQADSNAHRIISPRILVYPVVSKGARGTPSEIRA